MSFRPLLSEVDEKGWMFAASEPSLSESDPRCCHHSSHKQRNRQMSISSLINSHTLSTRTIIKIFIVTLLATYFSGLIPPPSIALYLFRRTLSSSRPDPLPHSSFEGLVHDPQVHQAASLPLDFFSRSHSREWSDPDSQGEHADNHSMEEDMVIDDRLESSRKPFKFPLRRPDPQVPAPLVEDEISALIDEDFEESEIPLIAADEKKRSLEFGADFEALHQEFSMLL